MATVSNIVCPPTTIQVFDSMPNIDLPPHAKAQIAATMCVKEAKNFLKFVSVQEQYGLSDCGVFAIAFATSLCARHSSAKITYIQHLLWPHLLQCLEEGVFTKFLPLQRKKK